MRNDDRDAAARGGISKGLYVAAAVVVVSVLAMLLEMSNLPSTYDEGITVTGAMRVAAGQVPHRDFYAIYGPAHFYVLAWVFKLFGETLFVERVLSAIYAGLVVGVVFVIASAFSRRSVAVWSTMTIAMWLLGIGLINGSAMVIVSFLNLGAAMLIVPVFFERLTIRRGLVAGFVAGLSTLFRYDAGLAMLCLQVAAIVFAVWVQTDRFSRWWKATATSLWPVLTGFAICTIPPAMYYLSVATFHDFFHDIVGYPSKYYKRARSLPFPAVHLKTFDTAAVYLPFLIGAVGLWIGVAGMLRARNEADAAPARRTRRWHGFLVVFSSLTLLMYLKGLVRISTPQMYLSIAPSIVLIAVLFEYKATLQRSMAIAIDCLMVCSVLTAVVAAAHQERVLQKNHFFEVATVVSARKGTLPPLEESWCRTPSALTRTLCFLPDDGRIQTIEFIDAHTTPDQTLFVGLTRHDRIIVNDNITYFATQRLPATHWSHFDPFLENRLDVQSKMVVEFEASKPPYIVLDSEWDADREPNGSALSTGVTLLDDYIQSHYHCVQVFDEMSILERNAGA